jgi:hypothetical protein
MARLDEKRRRAVREAFPKRRCSSKAKSTGTQCQHYAMVGANICATHGGMAPQVRAAAEQRVTLAEGLRAAPKRAPWDVLEDALHAADLLMREMFHEVQVSGSVTPQLLDRLVSSFERAHRLAKTNLDAGIDQRRLRLAEAQAGQMFAVFTRVLNSPALGLSAAQKALVPELLKREIAGEMAGTPKAVDVLAIAS